jgi:thiopeptide-type bacteriocin biosynthesis protein
MLNNYQLLETLIIRTPLLSTDTINANVFSKKELIKCYKDPIILEALFIASPSLYYEFVKLVENETDDSTLLNKIEGSLLKYLVRMSFRCTPFGTFAGFSVGKWGKANSFKLNTSNYEKHTRLDMFYLCSLAKEITNIPDVRNLLLYYPNNTIYKVGDELRYVETKFLSSTRKYEISAVEGSNELRQLLSKSINGAPIEELVRHLVDCGFDMIESKEYLSNLIDAQILVSELEPAITGGDFLEQIIDTLTKLETKTDNWPTKKIAIVLRTINEKVKEMDSKMGIHPMNYATILNELAVLNVPINPKYLIQTDLRKQLTLNENALDSKIAGSVRKAVNFLNLFLPFNKPHKPDLERFKQAFFSRYETKEVPLLEALDNEFGVGYISNEENNYYTPLVDDIFTTSSGQQEILLRRNENIDVLKRKMLDCLTSGGFEIELNDDDIRIRQDNLPLPDTFSAFGSIVSKNSQDNWQVLLKAVPGYGSATGFFGRLTPGDNNVDLFCKEICDIESKLYPDTIIAEIIHLPQSRVGNLIVRTQIRQYEIPILAKSSCEEKYQVELKDLMVSLDDEGNIVLRSKKLNKKILPRVASAHNFWVNALPIYHFLCDVQTQKAKQGLIFDLGIIGIQYPFYPRIKYGSVILSRATWIFSLKEIVFFIEMEQDKLIKQVETWRKKWKIPERILVIEDDNELFIDFTNELFVQLFKEELVKKKVITFTEYPFVGQCLITDEKNRCYTNEFIATFARKPENIKTQDTIIPNSSFKKRPLKRKFILGSPWVYYKLYMGVRTSDRVLTEVIKPLVVKLESLNIICKWFFVRYYDPDFHIRLRFEVSDKRNVHLITDNVFKKFNILLQDGVIFKVQTDTYDREIERYTEEAIEYVENIFSCQSKFVIDLLEVVNSVSKQEELILLVLVQCLLDLMTSFDLSEYSKHTFIKKSSENYRKEFQSNANSLKSIRLKFKYFEKFIYELDNGAGCSHEKLSGLLSSPTFIAYRNSSNVIIKQMKINIANSSATIKEEPILWSIFHMLANKLIYTKARKHEFLIYELLNEYFYRKNNTRIILDFQKKF